jgi:hypothetical protein
MLLGAKSSTSRIEERIERINVVIISPDKNYIIVIKSINIINLEERNNFKDNLKI